MHKGGIEARSKVPGKGYKWATVEVVDPVVVSDYTKSLQVTLRFSAIGLDDRNPSFLGSKKEWGQDSHIHSSIAIVFCDADFLVRVFLAFGVLNLIMIMNRSQVSLLRSCC